MRADFAEMGRLAVEMARKAAEVACTRNVILAAELTADDDAMDRLHRHMFTVLVDPAWPHGVAAAVDLTLLARYYERFADHAVLVARETVYAVTGASSRTRFPCESCVENMARAMFSAHGGQPNRPDT